jgi:hypothetical protein
MPALDPPHRRAWPPSGEVTCQRWIHRTGEHGLLPLTTHTNTYQRWIYRTDKTRANEFGLAYEDGDDSNKLKTSAEAGTAAAATAAATADESSTSDEPSAVETAADPSTGEASAEASPEASVPSTEAADAAAHTADSTDDDGNSPTLNSPAPPPPHPSFSTLVVVSVADPAASAQEA